MIQHYHLRREDSGSEFRMKTDIALLMPRRIGRGKGKLKLGDRFRFESKLDDSTFVARLIGVGKKGAAPTTKTWVLKSDAMGINPEQRVEAMQADAAIGCSVEYDDEGRAVYRSRKQYRKHAEAHGFFDRNGGYSSPVKRDAREREIMGLPPLYNLEPEPICLPVSESFG